MAVRSEFRFTLPKGVGVAVEEGRKASGIMRLIKVKDLIQIERDGMVRQNPGAFYIVLLSKVVLEMGKEKSISRKTIEHLSLPDFTFLVDFMQHKK